MLVTALHNIQVAVEFFNGDPEYFHPMMLV